MNYRTLVWRQWDDQEYKRLKQHFETLTWIKLNNLYLQVQRGAVQLTITVCNQLRTLASEAYPADDLMQGYWQGEFEKLPGWHNF